MPTNSSTSNTNKNYYELLGVSQDADDRTIKLAFLKLAKEKHPDKGGSAEQFKVLKEAYDVLKDPNRRATYDNSIRNMANSRPRAAASSSTASSSRQSSRQNAEPKQSYPNARPFASAYSSGSSSRQSSRQTPPRQTAESTGSSTANQASSSSMKEKKYIYSAREMLEQLNSVLGDNTSNDDKNKFLMDLRRQDSDTANKFNEKLKIIGGVLYLPQVHVLEQFKNDTPDAWMNLQSTIESYKQKFKLLPDEQNQLIEILRHIVKNKQYDLLRPSGKNKINYRDDKEINALI